MHVTEKTSQEPPRPISLVDLRAEYELLGDELQSEVKRVIKSGCFVLGPELKALEESFAQYCGAEFAVGVNSGSSALELALRACGIGAGDEVIVPAHTFIASVMSVMNVGASPVLVDVREDSCCIDVEAAEAAVTEKTRAVMPVHLYGHTADMTALAGLAKRAGLLLIEDAAQAHGAEHEGRRAGAMGACGCFSFYPTKNLGAAGEAGMVITGDADVAGRLARLRNHGRSAHDEFVQLGFNERMDNLQAAVLNVKLRHLEAWNERRREIAALYSDALAGLPLKLPVELDGNKHVYHQFVVRTKHRDALAGHLRGRGIGTAVHYATPPHRQPVFRDGPLGRGRHPVAEMLAREVLSLPVHPHLTDGDVARVAREVGSFFSDALANGA